MQNSVTQQQNEIIPVNAKFSIECGFDSRDRPCVSLIEQTPKGKYSKTKITNNYYFPTVAMRDNWVIKKASMIHEDDKKNTERIAAKKEAQKVGQEMHSVKVGDIFYRSWGYEQTNIDYFEVLAVSKASATFRQLKTSVTETGYMSGKSTPIKGKYTKDSEFKKIIKFQINDGKVAPYINFESGWCQSWDGKPKTCSWYA